MEMEAIIKDYLEKNAETDPAFKLVYNPDKVDECVKKIFDKLQEFYVKKNKQISGGCAVDHNIVFKMARDFFIDGKFEVDEESVITFKQSTKKDTPEETEEERLLREQKEKEEQKQRELEKIKREQEERERKQYEKEHKNGQTTIFDLGA